MRGRAGAEIGLNAGPRPLARSSTSGIATIGISIEGQSFGMSVDADTVRRVAHLARIAVADDEVEHLRGELNAMLAFVEQLSEVDIAGVEPMTSVMPMAMKMRKDEITDGGIADAVMANAPAREDHFFSFLKWWNDVPCL
jgi:aspartyl-tRNA(Asn)/glutamyl-tRNA(Gln) amidotransferase subunit C